MAAALEKVFSQFTNLLSDIDKESDEENLVKAFSMEVASINYDVVDEEINVMLRLDLDGIDTHPEDLINIDIQPWSLEVQIRGYVRLYCLKICRFYAKIDAKRSLYIKSGGYILFKLRKVVPGKWNHLTYHHPEIIKNFKKSIEDFVQSSAVIRDQDTNPLYDMWVLETFPTRGIDFRYFLILNDVNVPSEVITIDQMREFLKSYIEPSKSAHLIWLATSFFLCEKKKYEELHPEVLIEYDRRPKPKTAAHPKAEQLRQKGLSAFRSKEYLNAIDAFTAAINQAPQIPIYYLDRADVYTRLDLATNSLDDISRAMMLDSFNSKAHLCLGKNLLSSGMRKEASDSLRNAKILNPLNQEIDKQIIQTYKCEYSIGMYIEAARNGDEGKKNMHLTSIQDFIEPYVASETLMRLLLDQGMIEEARTEASNLSSLRPYSEYIKLSYLALCAYYEDDENKFNEYFRKAKKLKTNHGEKDEYCEFIAQFYLLRKQGDDMFKKDCYLGYLDAIKIYLEILKNPDVCPMLASKLYYKIAAAHYKLNDIEEAILFLGGAIGKRSDFHEAFAARGEHYMKKKEFAEALKDFEKANEISPCSKYQQLISKARSKQPLRKETAVSKSDKYSSLKKLSNNSLDMKESQNYHKQKSLIRSKKEKGNKHFMENRYEEAIRSYTEVIELDPGNPDFYSKRAACHISLKDFEEGIFDAEKAVSLDSDLMKGFHQLGYCNIALGKLDEGIRFLEKAKKLNISELDVGAELAAAYTLREVLEKANNAFTDKDYATAAPLYSSVLEKAEACVRLRLKRIECLIHVEEYDDALSEAELATSLDPTNYNIFSFMGLCHFSKGETSRAIASFELTWSLDTSSTKWLELIKRLAQYKNSLRNANGKKLPKLFSELKDQILTSVNLIDKKMTKKKTTSENEKGNDCLKEDRNKGIKEFNTNTTLDTQDDLQVALYHVKMQNFKEALQHSQKAVDKDVKCLEGLILIGKCNTILGNMEEAISAFERATTIDANNKQVIEGIKKTEKLKKLLNDAEKALKEKKFSTAHELFSFAFKIAHRNSALLLSIADCLISLEKFSELDFTLSLWEGLPTTEFICINSLIAYYRKGNCDMTFLQSALAMDPSNKMCQKYLNILQSVDEIKTKALKALGSDLDEALSLFHEALEIDPTNPLLTSEFYYYIGFIMMKRDEAANAIEYFSKAICKRAKYVLALEKRALCYKKLRKFEEAINDYLTLHKWQNDHVYKQLANDVRDLMRKGI